MSVRWLLAAAMAALVVLAIGHTAATLRRETTGDPKVAAAFEAMRAAVVPRTAKRFSRNMADLDLGMNLNLSIALASVVAVLGLLISWADSSPALVRTLLWPILFFTVGVGATSLYFFYALPAVALCAAASAALVLALIRLAHG